MITLEVSLAGRPHPWYPVGARDVMELLTARQWTERGRVLWWQLTDDDARRALMLERLTAAFWAIDGGDTDPLIRHIAATAQEEREDAALSDVLTRELVPGVALSGIELVEQLARLSDYRPTVLFVSTRGAMSGWGDQAKQLVDQAARMRPAVPLTLILASHGDRATRRNYHHELVHGWPSDALASELMGRVERLWALYVHHRVAWEVAGDLDTLGEMFPPDLNFPGVGEDEALEQLLNERAKAHYATVPDAIRAAWTQQLRTMRWNGENPFTITRQLPGPPLLWSRQQHGVPVIIPWIARAMLQVEEDMPQGARSWLRHSLVAESIASELLMRCIDVESLVRRRTYAFLDTSALANETQKRLDQFIHRAGEGEHIFYPDSHPARPDQPTMFASLGEWLTAVDRTKTSDIEAWHRLRILRNALAHGHYVSWPMIEWLRDISGRLPS